MFISNELFRNHETSLTLKEIQTVEKQIKIKTH